MNKENMEFRPQPSIKDLAVRYGKTKREMCRLKKELEAAAEAYAEAEDNLCKATPNNFGPAAYSINENDIVMVSGKDGAVSVTVAKKDLTI